jgi:DNA-binding MarR family transcriptional regulator
MVAACRALYDAIDRLDAVAAGRVGISRNDLRALNALERGPCRPRDLAAALGLTTGSVTSLIDRLETRGLVRRAPDPGDRRGVLVVPTEAMFAVLGPLYRAVAERVADLAVAYGPDEARAAARHVRDVADAYEAAPRRAAAPPVASD